MDDLSYFIQDIVENSLNVKAKNIQLYINENVLSNRITVRITDNGCGMDKETLSKVLNPFYTTRTTRKVGLGLSFFRESALQTGGSFDITSSLGLGTIVEARYVLNHIDTPVLGDIAETIMTILTHPILEHFVYVHEYNQKSFHLDTDELKHTLEIVSFEDPQLLLLIKQYITDLLKEIRGGTK